MKKITSLLLFIFTISLTYSAPITQGHVKYKVKMSSEDKENQKMMAMFSNMTLEIFFKYGKTRTEMKMGPLMSMTTISDSESGKVLMLVGGILGKKAIQTSVDELESKGGEEAKKADKSEVIYTDETKKVQGYLCHKAIIKSESGGESIIWYTKAIEIDKSGQAYLNEEIPGFPMEFEMNEGGMKITMVASLFETSLGKKSSELFSMNIPEGYEEMSLEEMEGK